MKKVWITGKTSQLGLCLRDTTESLENLTLLFTGRDEVDLGNGEEIENFIAANAPDLIINCAAYTNVEGAEEERETAFKINAEAPEILAKESKKQDIPLIQISTDYVYEDQSNTPLSEGHETQPLSVYGKSKLAGEMSILLKNDNSYILRTSWLYSPYGKNFLKSMLDLGSKKEQLSVVFDQCGTPTSALDLAQDLIRICKAILFEKEKPAPGIYNYSNEGVCTWFDFAQAIMDLAGLNCKVHPVLSEEFPTKAQRPAYSVMDKKKFKVTFKKDLPHWRDSLEICLAKILS